MIYFIKCNDMVKIGYTKEDVQRRLHTLQVGCPYKLEILNIIEGDETQEKILHNRLGRHRVRGEWFELNEEVMLVVRHPNVAPQVALAKDRTLTFRCTDAEHQYIHIKAKELGMSVSDVCRKLINDMRDMGVF